MQAIVLLNGEPYRGEIYDKGSYVICCDGAYAWAKGRVHIDENLGDFDSYEGEVVPPPTKIYPSEKNETDGELAVDRLLEMHASTITFYGGGGGREDHFLGNLHLLYKAYEGGAAVAMVTNRSRIFFFGKGEHTFDCDLGITLSFIPFGGDAHIISSSGLKYPLDDLTLKYGATRGISNVAVEENVAFNVGSGYVLVIGNMEEA